MFPIMYDPTGEGWRQLNEWIANGLYALIKRENRKRVLFVLAALVTASAAAYGSVLLIHVYTGSSLCHLTYCDQAMKLRDRRFLANAPWATFAATEGIAFALLFRIATSVREYGNFFQALPPDVFNLYTRVRVRYSMALDKTYWLCFWSTNVCLAVGAIGAFALIWLFCLAP